jgi:hypothetical protein
LVTSQNKTKKQRAKRAHHTGGEEIPRNPDARGGVPQGALSGRTVG